MHRPFVLMRVSTLLFYIVGWIVLIDGMSRIIASITPLSVFDLRMLFHGAMIFSLGGLGMLRTIFRYGLSFSHPGNWYRSTLQPPSPRPESPKGPPGE